MLNLPGPVHKLRAWVKRTFPRGRWSSSPSYFVLAECSLFLESSRCGEEKGHNIMGIPHRMHHVRCNTHFTIRQRVTSSSRRQQWHSVAQPFDLLDLPVELNLSWAGDPRDLIINNHTSSHFTFYCSRLTSHINATARDGMVIIFRKDSSVVLIMKLRWVFCIMYAK